ncbi:MarR family winged helix-turn-helix transcriptional regulator [Deinococcus sp.]|uniref:MarR family winged helix-turn-helix transcriptional regulator n=1 Tax=Deinococcus sp. TaxID=47478 RepID=UPI0025BC0422|nr:MarR family winged helix-turn-helix transcriptional regulator [Deinococcus sp.]
MTVSFPIQFLSALWNLWQSLAAEVGARLREEAGLDLKEFIVAGYLQDGAASPTELAQNMQMPRYEVSRLLGNLEDKGYAKRTRSHADGRHVNVQLTETGYAAWERGIATIEVVTEPYLSGLDPARREDLMLTLAGLVRPQP